MSSLQTEFEKLSKEYFSGGKADNKTDKDYDAKQIAMGEKIEKEHTNSAAKAREIARDHLEEFPNYYSALNKMENRLKLGKISFS